MGRGDTCSVFGLPHHASLAMTDFNLYPFPEINYSCAYDSLSASWEAVLWCLHLRVVLGGPPLQLVQERTLLHAD